MLVHQSVNTLFNSCTYVLTDVGANCIIIDPGDIEPILDFIDNRLCSGILLTHGHFDHIYGLNSLLKRFPETGVYCSLACKQQLMSDSKNLSRYNETPFVFQYPDNVIIVEGGDSVTIDGTEVQVIATPGHHPSCLTFAIGDCLFTGDAYIPGIKVVTNLPGGDKRLAEESLKIVSGLITSCHVYPGHPGKDF